MRHEASDGNRVASVLLEQELHTAWKYATRALNVAESISLPDTRNAIAEIVIQLSKNLEFIESELQTERIQMRRDERERKETEDASCDVETSE